MCYSPKLHGNWLVAFTSWEVFCFFSLHAGVDVSPFSASQSKGTLAVVERLLSWIFLSWVVFCFFYLPAGADVFPRSASQSRGTLAMVERLLSWIFIFLLFFLDSLLGFLFLFSGTLCISRGSPYSSKPQISRTISSRKSHCEYPAGLTISVCSALCAWNKIKLLTTAKSMRWC